MGVRPRAGLAGGRPEGLAAGGGGGESGALGLFQRRML